MSVSEVSLDDGVVFARSIRSLARQAHLMLQRPTTDREIQGLIGRIDRLEQEASRQGSEDLVRWLGSLRRVVEEQVMASI